ncbi:MAG: ATPase, partial [Sphaerochaetaceae bacterium]|nr:ATPase [Sphaerochaetaceae bacterium]
AGQTMMAAAMHTPISVLTTAGEGGAWGIALLSCFAADGDGRKLDDFLNEEVFRNSKASTLVPEKEDIEGFDRFFEMYKKALPIEREAAKHID